MHFPPFEFSRWFQFWKPSLGRKIAAAFTIFGLIIGYLSYLFHTMMLTREFVNMTAAMVAERLYILAGERKNDAIMGLLNGKSREVRDIAIHIKRYYDKTHRIIDFNLFYFHTGMKKWFRIYADERNAFRSTPVKPTVAVSLGEALVDGISFNNFDFWSRRDDFSVKVDITRKGDLNRYVLGFDINRSGLLTKFRENMMFFLILGISTLVVSYILGQIFAYYLVKPVRQLSESARKISQGDYSATLEYKRKDELGILARSFNVMSRRIQANLNELEERMNAMATMNKIDKAVLSSQSSSDLMDRVIMIVYSLISCDFIALAVINEEKRGFDILSFLEGRTSTLLGEKPFVHNGMFWEETLKRQGQFFQMVNRMEGETIDPVFQRVIGYKVGGIVNAPLWVHDRNLGSLLISRREEEPFSSKEMDHIRLLSDQVAVALQSVIMREERENLLMGILLALTRSIDAKSRWTAGHSERVARIAEQIALEMEFSQEDMRILTITSVLHDIGKLAIPEAVLDKTGRLTKEERQLIEMHPMAGARIIADIPSYGRIMPGVLHHHEHWDGSGYPQGWKGEDIPLNSRIITVADVYDAITDDRPYRKGMDTGAALKFMGENSGRLFDPCIVNIFLSVITRD